MKPIQEITLFNSSAKIDDVSKYLDVHALLDICVPVKGLLFEEKISVQNFEKVTLKASAGNIQSFCTGTETFPVFIRPEGKDMVIVARVNRVITNRNELSLCDFRILKTCWNERKAERVQPSFPQYFSMDIGGEEVHVNLHDISTTGICVIANIADEKIRETILNSQTRFSLIIRPNLKKTRLTGKIVEIHSLTNSLVRLGLEIYPQQADLCQLEEYVKMRKQEIIDELRANFTGSLDFQQTKNLWF